jgi:hypothetical protein
MEVNQEKIVGKMQGYLQKMEANQKKSRGQNGSIYAEKTEAVA